MLYTEDFFQVSPSSPSAAEFTARLTDIRASLLSSAPQWPHDYHLAANPYPFYIAPRRLAELQNLQSALHTALLAIVKNWWSTPRYQAAIPTSPKVERVLRSLASRRPYTAVGCYRPDFLIPLQKNGPLAICEINARFSFNCYLSGAYVQEYLARPNSQGDMPGLKKCTANGIVSAFSELFDETKPLGLVKGRESGYDIHLFRQSYCQSRFVDPRDLRLVPCSVSPSGYTLADDIGPIEQFALELHQDELEAFDEETLSELGARCFNDLHTVFLVHDKRMLGLIQQELDLLVSSAALTAAQAKALRCGLVETHLPGTKSFRHILDDVRNKHMWLVKPCQAGKGEGIFFGKDLDDDAWRHILDPKQDGASEIPCIIQRNIVQRKYNLVMNPSILGESPRRVNWAVVGTILCLNQYFLGPTFWRTSDSDITAVSRGGAYMGGVTNDTASLKSPKITPKLSALSTLSPVQIPNAARVQVHSLDSLSDSQHIATVASALKTHGIAVIHLNFEDPSSSYMLNLACSLGTPIDHSKANDPLWDVKSKVGTGLARSQTVNSFPWHTDCSFDTKPPRYFALHVIQSDRLGGGNLAVLPLDRILESLSPSTVETLKQPVFQIRVPPEFRKDVPHVVGALVTPDGKIRFRREIIEPLGTEAERALEELDAVLGNSVSKGWAKVLGKDVMKNGTVVCLDNARWMHARSEVRDPERWLRRIRWGPETF